MLAEAARGMGLRDASLVYFRRAVQAGEQYGCGDPAGGCEGFDVPKLAALALGR
jgi:hypothetical protein